MVAVDATIARLAAQQKELVTRDALLGEAVTAAALRHRLRTGRLRRVHPGVYTTAAGPLTQDQAWLAAVLACRPEAGLGDDHAAAPWRMLSMPPGPIAVVRSGRHRDGPKGVRLRHTSTPELTTHRGIPVPTPSRTLLDLAAYGPPGRVELALYEAFTLRLITRATIAGGDGPARQPDPPRAPRGRSGRLAPGGRAAPQTADPRGAAAEGLLRRLRRRPRARRLLAGAPPDRRGRRLGLPRGPDRVRADRARDAELLAPGYRTVRFTWRQLTHEPSVVIARLAGALACSPTQPPSTFSGRAGAPARS